MVKADLSRDYYGDLEVAPTADINEVKKQFKKLALQYHPDRNPGRESEVTAAFQKIQSAHEVLTDPQERAKYDANRVRPTNRYQTGGNQRGNPWSNVGSQFPPPPKPPTARNRPPPPSAGAQRYKNFETPRQSASQFAQEGPEARKSTFQAWEHMRNSAKSGREPATGPPNANGTSRSGREESNGYKHRPPPKAAPDYDEFRANYSPGGSPHRRAQSTSAQQRKGFMPNTPMGDEPAAPRNAYFTSQRKSAQAPEPPPRNNAPPPPPPTPAVDPLRQFREQSNTPYEPRLSTPYATHGGEKLNPFEASNVNRSKSTREPRDRFAGSPNIPRAGSDSNLKNTTPYQPRTSAPGKSSEAAIFSSDDSNSDSAPKAKMGTKYEDRPFAKARKFPQPSQRPTPFPPMTQKNAAQKPDISNGQKTNGPTGPGQPDQPSNGESIFNFKVDENTFQRTNTNGFSSSAENINTKFTPEEWEGKFEAGYFQPEQKAANMSQHTRSRAQSGSRSRGRSPVKVRPTPVIDPQYVHGNPRPVHDPHYPQHTQSESETPAESPGGTKFSQAEWAGTFKPQTFMPPPPPPPAPGKTPSRTTRRPRGPSVKQTAGTAAIVIDDSSDSGNEKPLFIARKSFVSAPPQPARPPQSARTAPSSPDAMDVDTPPVFKPATPVHGPPVGLGVNTSPGKRPAVPSQDASPIDQEALKVNFEDMKIQDLISSMDLPKPPTPANDIAILANDVRSQITEPVWLVHLSLVAEYMKAWDLFSNRILLHLVARKNQNDGLGEKRWTEEASMRTYRLGLREDKVVFAHLIAAEKAHEEVVKNHAIVRERMTKMLERQREPPRKKVS